MVEALAWRGEIGQESETLELIQKARTGDMDAFDLLILRYERRVLKVAYQLVGNRDDAQDVFVRLYKYLGKVRDDQKFATWLYRLAVNASYDLLNRRSSYREIIPLEGPSGQLHDVPDERTVPGDRSAEAIELKEKVLASLDRLTPSERIVFVLKDIDGLEVNEIAGIQAISQITVRRHLSTARHKMRAILAALHPSLARRGDHEHEA